MRVSAHNPNETRMLPGTGVVAFSVALMFALVTPINALHLPIHILPHLQLTSDMNSMVPYSPGETFAGGPADEHVPSADLQQVANITGGQSVQSGQLVNPGTGDFSYNIPWSRSVPLEGGNLGCH